MSDEATLAFEYVVRKAREKWNYRNSYSFFPLLFRLLRLVPKAKVLYIQKYENGNLDRCSLSGKPVQTWQLDDKGLRSIDEIGELDKARGIFSTTPVYSYCVLGPPFRMILLRWEGGRCGDGSVMAFDESEHSWKHESTRWIS
jgi:hypothetical protein